MFLLRRGSGVRFSSTIQIKDIVPGIFEDASLLDCLIQTRILEQNLDFLFPKIRAKLLFINSC